MSLMIRPRSLCTIALLIGLSDTTLFISAHADNGNTERISNFHSKEDVISTRRLDSQNLRGQIVETFQNTPTYLAGVISSDISPKRAPEGLDYEVDYETNPIGLDYDDVFYEDGENFSSGSDFNEEDYGFPLEDPYYEEDFPTLEEADAYEDDFLTLENMDAQEISEEQQDRDDKITGFYNDEAFQNGSEGFKDENPAFPPEYAQDEQSEFPPDYNEQDFMNDDGLGKTDHSSDSNHPVTQNSTEGKEQDDNSNQNTTTIFIVVVVVLVFLNLVLIVSVLIIKNKVRVFMERMKAKENCEQFEKETVTLI